MKTLTVKGWKLAIFFLSHDETSDELRKTIEQSIEGKDDTETVEIETDIEDAFNRAVCIMQPGWAKYLGRKRFIEERQHAVRSR